MAKNKEIDNSYGVASFVLGLIGLLFFIVPFIGLIYPILAIVFYNVQKKNEITGLSTAGFVMGIIGIMLRFIIFIIFIFGIALFNVITI